jgi:hypothetical protein
MAQRGGTSLSHPDSALTQGFTHLEEITPSFQSYHIEAELIMSLTGSSVLSSLGEAPVLSSFREEPVLNYLREALVLISLRDALLLHELSKRSIILAWIISEKHQA